MKLFYKALFSFLFALCPLFAKTQSNLVPNPGYEIFSSCPDNTGEINYLSDWKIYMNTPDFFSNCASVSYMSVPNNWRGYQEANSGNSYIGFFCYATNGQYREIAGVYLITPLSIGQKYYIKFNANLSLEYSNANANCAIKTLGLKFTTVDYSVNQNPPIDNSAHLISSGFITDTLNWTNVFGSFVADSAYSYLMLGNFYDDANTPKIRYGGTPDSNAYYFIDDVCVSTDSVFTANFTNIKEEEMPSQISIYPNPASNYFSIDFPFLKDYCDILIYDALGREVFSKQKVYRKEKIDISTIPKGVLIVKVFDNNQVFVSKLLKQ